MRRFVASGSLLTFVLAGLVGCSGEGANDANAEQTESGGTASGIGGNGAETSTGGVSSSGGAAVGGSSSSGGLGNGGENPGVGGMATGGSVSTGGDVGTGGDPSTGGDASTGGGAGTGGAPGTGGNPARDPNKDGFVHPGILVNKAMLDFVKGKLASNAQPWKGALDKAKNDWEGSLSYTPHPHAVVECGAYSNPDIGCSDEKNDAVAAFTHALLWYHTGNDAYAKKAIQIMDAWSAVLTDHTNSNGPLQAAWVAEMFPRAAEIIRYTYDGWPADKSARFGKMLKDVYLPEVINGSSSNGNWELSMIEAAINIGIYNDDLASFNKGVKMWRERVPAYVYLKSDGATPVPPPRGNKTGAALIGFWYNQSTFVDGLSQETCRDLSHVQYGLAAIINAAETARVQGIDLYGEEQARIRATLGFHATYMNGAAVPSWLCNGALKDIGANPMWEIAYNHYKTTLGYDMPQTQILVNKIRPTGATHHMAWETLTHGDIGGVGLPGL